MSEKNVHVAQEPHDAAHCEINAPEHSHPEVDCGHTVNAGPGVAPQKPVSKKPFCAPDPTAPGSIDGDQDPTHGSGVQ